jgi:prepilin-type N-terminal cleavage/methylation domain-containing protein
MPTHPQSCRAFSLLETAIALVIVALLAGFISVGQSFVRSNEVRTIMIDANGFIGAAGQFRDRYGAFPGDFSEAGEIWGYLSGPKDTTTVGSNGEVIFSRNCNTVFNEAADPNNPKLTCNGDGNGVIDATSLEQESYRAWHHLQAAEMISGSFTGISGSKSGRATADAGVNVPKGPGGRDMGYSFDSQGEMVGNAIYFDGNYNNILTFGREQRNDLTIGKALTPVEAAEIDLKTDDGKPALGVVRTVKSALSASAANPTPFCVKSDNSAYNLELRSKECRLIFMGLGATGKARSGAFGG